MNETNTAERIKNILALNRLPAYASILNTERDPKNTSERYVESDDLEIIETMNSLGWFITSYSQAKSHKPEELKYKPYLASYENPDLHMLTTKAGKIKINQLGSKDGTTKLTFDLEFFSKDNSSTYIPSEKTCPSISLKHIGKVRGQVQEIVAELLKSAPKVLEKVARMGRTPFNPIAQNEFAQRAAALRFNGGKYEVSTRDVLQIYKESDLENNLWATFSRVQKTLIMSEDLFMVEKKNLKRRKAKAVVNVKAAVLLNKQLWELAEEYLK